MFHTSWLLPLTILHNFYVHSVAISLLKKLKWILCYQNFLHWQKRMPMTIYHWKCPFEILQGLFWRCGCNFKYLRQISLECTKIIKIGWYLTVSQKCRWIFFTKQCIMTAIIVVSCRHCFNNCSGHATQNFCWLYSKLPEWGPGIDSILSLWH